MLLSHRLEKNISIKYDEFHFDEDYLKSNYINDKIIDIQWNNKDFIKLIQELKKYISNVSTKINQYLIHIDYDSLEYIKDIYYDLALPFTLNKSEKVKINTSFYKIIFDEILQKEYSLKNIKFNCSKTIKESIIPLLSENSSTKSKLLISTNVSHIKDENELIKQINSVLKLDNGDVEDSTKKTLEKYITTYFSEKHIKTVSKIINDLFTKINSISKNDSLIYKISILNSKKIQYVLDYLTTIFENVYIINSFTTNILKEEFIIICKNKIRESYIRDIPKISYKYMSANYCLISNLIYFVKIYKKKLLEIFKTTDKFFFINGNIRNKYDDFESYFNDLSKNDIYKLHLNRVFMK